MSTVHAQSLELNNGVTIPALGLGVFQTPPDETRDAVRRGGPEPDAITLDAFGREIPEA